MICLYCLVQLMYDYCFVYKTVTVKILLVQSTRSWQMNLVEWLFVFK